MSGGTTTHAEGGHKVTKEQVIAHIQQQHHAVEQFAEFIKHQVEHEIPEILAHMNEEGANADPETARQIADLTHENEQLRSQVNHDTTGVNRNDEQIHQDFERLKTEIKTMLANKQVMPTLVEEALAHLRMIKQALTNIGAELTNKSAAYDTIIQNYNSESNQINELIRYIKEDIYDLVKDDNSLAEKFIEKISALNGADQQILVNLHKIEALQKLVDRLQDDITNDNLLGTQEFARMKSEFKFLEKLKENFSEFETNFNNIGDSHENNEVVYLVRTAKGRISALKTLINEGNLMVYRENRLSWKDEVQEHILLKKNVKQNQEIFKKVDSSLKYAEKVKQGDIKSIRYFRSALSSLIKLLERESDELVRLEKIIPKLKTPMQAVAAKCKEIISAVSRESHDDPGLEQILGLISEKITGEVVQGEVNE